MLHGVSHPIMAGNTGNISKMQQEYSKSRGAPGRKFVEEANTETVFNKRKKQNICGSCQQDDNEIREMRSKRCIKKFVN